MNDSEGRVYDVMIFGGGMSSIYTVQMEQCSRMRECSGRVETPWERV